MLTSPRAAASVLVLALTLSACGGHSTLPAKPSQSNAQSQAASSASASAPLISIPRTYGALAFKDKGRRASSAPVSVTLMLRYNHQAELDQFVAAQSAPGGPHHFLTPAQFNDYYAPAVQQEQAVVKALQSAGFTITHRYSNRTVVDASAPSATVE